MPTTISGNIKNLATGSVGSSQNAILRFILRGTGESQPVITGTGAIAPTSANGIWYTDLAADANGAVSGTIYSTRDATGLLAGDITVSGSGTAVYYDMVVIANGMSGPSQSVHAKNGATLDPSSETPITTPPVVSAPTGDGTYLRTDAGNGPVTGLLTLSAGAVTKKLNNIRFADQFSGSDIGAKINAAFADGANQCTVYVPAGNYSFSTTISFPVVANGTAQLILDSGAVLIYTGSGYAISLAGTGQGFVNALIEGGRLIGSSAGLGGIHVARFNRGAIWDISIENFSTGDGIHNLGANTIGLFNVQLVSNLNGIHNVGDGAGFAPNAVKAFGCHFWGNTGWGLYEDNSGAGGGTGGTIGNQYIGCTFEFNGANANASISGHAFLNSGAGHVIENCYFEYSGSSTVLSSIKVGDGSVKPIACVIRHNTFVSKGTTNTILAYSNSLRVEDNYEGTANTNFFNQVSGATSTALGFNNVSSTNPTAGSTAGYVVNQIAGASSWYFPQTIASTTIPQQLVESGASGTEIEIALGRTAIEHRLVGVATAGTYVGDSQVGDLVIRSDAGVIRLGQTGGNSSVQIGNGTFAVGGGTNLTNIKVYSQSLTPSSVNAATCSEQSFTVTGVTTSDKIIFNPPTQSTAAFPAYAYVSATNTVKIGFINPTAGALTPSSGTYLFIAIRS